MTTKHHFSWMIIGYRFVASGQKATLFKTNKNYFMPVIKITSETNLLHNETRYFIRIDGKFIQGFDTLDKAEEVAQQIASNGGREKTDEITLKEIIC